MISTTSSLIGKPISPGSSRCRSSMLRPLTMYSQSSRPSPIKCWYRWGSRWMWRGTVGRSCRTHWGRSRDIASSCSLISITSTLDGLRLWKTARKKDRFTMFISIFGIRRLLLCKSWTNWSNNLPNWWEYN
jgi:hypothetical protein